MGLGCMIYTVGDWHASSGQSCILPCHGPGSGPAPQRTCDGGGAAGGAGQRSLSQTLFLLIAAQLGGAFL